MKRFVRSALALTGVLFGVVAVGCSSTPSPRLPELARHKAIISIKEGMTEEEIRNILGPPDEVREVAAGHLLDGTQLLSARNPENEEAYRWAYRPLQPGGFASGGAVSFDQKGRVIAAGSPILGWALGTAPGANDRPETTASTNNLSCRIEDIGFEEADGETVRGWSAQVTLKNIGDSEYVKESFLHTDLQCQCTVQVCDSESTVLYVDDHRMYYSPASLSSPRVWKLPAGGSATERVSFGPDHYFGPLPPGRYFLRVCFPDTDHTFIESNLAEFSVPEFPQDSEYWGRFRARTSSGRSNSGR